MSKCVICGKELDASCSYFPAMVSAQNFCYTTGLAGFRKTLICGDCITSALILIEQCLESYEVDAAKAKELKEGFTNESTYLPPDRPKLDDVVQTGGDKKVPFEEVPKQNSLGNTEFNNTLVTLSATRVSGDGRRRNSNIDEVAFGEICSYIENNGEESDKELAKKFRVTVQVIRNIRNSGGDWRKYNTPEGMPEKTTRKSSENERSIDYGKMKSLAQAGWFPQDIASDMGLEIDIVNTFYQKFLAGEV